MSIEYFSNEEEKRKFLERAEINTDSIIKVGSTSYDIKDKWFKLVNDKFGIKNMDISTDEDINDVNLNMLKSGIFGYINEINAHEIKNAIYHRNILYDEHFLNSASFPSSIYNFAKLYNVPIRMAKPARMDVVLTIRKTDLINMPSRKVISSDMINKDKALRTYEITLDRDQEFNVEDFKFLLPYDIKIRVVENLVTKNENDYISESITAIYDMNDRLFPFSEVLNRNIKVSSDRINGIEYYHFRISLFQLEREEHSFDISSDDMMDTMFFDVDFEGELAGFNVYYEYMGEVTPLKMYFNNYNSPKEKEKFCYYNFANENNITISFSNLNNSFRPKSNSRIIVEVLTTEGENGNFNYNREVNLKLENDNAFKNTPITLLPASSSSNGKNKPKAVEEKQRIINKLLTREAIILDTDIDNYFKEVNEEYNVNDSKVSFVKKRNDILDRTYGAFLLLKDREGKVLPTNTAPRVKFDKRYFSGITQYGNPVDGYSIPENSIFIYDYNSKEYRYIPSGIEDKSVRDKYLNDRNSLIYVNPYLLKIDNDPYLQSNYFKVDLDEEYNVVYNYMNSLIPFNIVVNDMEIRKINNYPTSMESDTFRISVELDMHDRINDIKDDLVVRGTLFSAETDEKYGYFELNPKQSDDPEDITSYNIYEGLVSTNRKFKNNKLSLSDSLYDENGKVITDAFIDEKLDLHISVLYKDSTVKYYPLKDNDLKFYKQYEDRFPTHSDEDMEDYSLALVASTTKNVVFYENMRDIMKSNIYETTRFYEIEMIPLISLDYYLFESRSIYRIMEQYNDILRIARKRIENNTSIDMKFYNTRGPSSNFFIDAKRINENVENVYISRTDILLDFTFHLFHSIDDHMDKKVKKFISDYIEECNVEGLVAISNLIRLLEENFDVIKYIEYNGISGLYEEQLNNKYQRVIDGSRRMLDMNKQEIIDYVPEYINIKKEVRDNKIEYADKESPNNIGYLDLGRSHEYVINITYINKK